MSNSCSVTVEKMGENGRQYHTACQDDKMEDLSQKLSSEKRVFATEKTAQR